MPLRNNRIAAVDVGTNSIRGIVVEVERSGKFRVLDDEKINVRLGDGLTKLNRISPAAWHRAMQGISRIKKIAEGYEVKAIEAVATSAVRLAANGKAFVNAVREETGLQIQVISGEEEAELAAMSVRNNFDMDGIYYGIVDIGGGSVEIATALSGHIEEVHSLDLGTVFLTERFLKHAPVRAGEMKKLRKHIHGALVESFGNKVISLQSIIGSGGSITSTAAMVMAMRRESFGTVHGYDVLHSEVVHLHAMLSDMDIKARKMVPGINPERADIIVAGITVIECLMEFFNTNLLRVNERGIREGIILRAIKKHNIVQKDIKPREWRQSVMEFARSCHFDAGHSMQVARLALNIFDAVAREYALGENERRILEAAALLHDVGYLISYSGHHKHSLHLIRHADLFGFTPREKEIIGNVARYHRRSMPKKSHDSYNMLSSKDKLLINKLSGILRLADGLDRQRNSVIGALRCKLTEKTFSISFDGAENMPYEFYGGEAKKNFFEKAFQRKIVFHTKSQNTTRQGVSQ